MTFLFLSLVAVFVGIGLYYAWQSILAYCLYEPEEDEQCPF